MDRTLAQLVERFKQMGGPPALSALRREDDILSPYARLWLNENEASKYADTAEGLAALGYKACGVQFEVKSEKNEEGQNEFRIQGWLSTKDLDLDNEVLLPEAFRDSLQPWLDKGGSMLFMHDWWAIPIGRWTKAEVRENGIWVEGVVANTVMGIDIQTLIKLGVLRTLSIGFRIKKDEWDRESGIRTITLGEILEGSIVNLPANPNAVFEMAKQRHLKSLIHEDPGQFPGKGTTTMNPELLRIIEAMGRDWDPAKSVKGTFSELDGKLETFNRTMKQVSDKFAEMQDPTKSVTPADFNQFCERTKADVTTLMESIKALKLAQEVLSTPREIVSDWRSLLKKGAYLRDENGRPLPEQYQKAYRILNVPCDYEKSQHGALIKAACNLNDYCLMLDALYRKAQPPGYRGIASLDAFQKMAEIIERIDPELGRGMKAMYTGGAGVGYEWMPTLWSAEFETLFRLQPRLANYLRPKWQMPSATAKWPILTAGATGYIIPEAGSNNPVVMTPSDLGSSVITFAVVALGARLPISKLLIEDTLFDLLGTVREEQVICLGDIEEDAIVNGDNSATHFDTGRSLTSDSLDVKCAWKGIRKICAGLSNTWNTQSTSTGVGDATAAFVAKDVRYNRYLLGELGVDPSQLLHVSGIEGYYKALNFAEVTKANEFGYASTWLTGRLPALDGVEIYVSPKWPANLNTSGIYDASTETCTAWGTIHRRSFMQGEKRGVTLEVDYDPNVQQYTFIATMRRDFQNMRPSTQKPVAIGINILK